MTNKVKITKFIHNIIEVNMSMYKGDVDGFIEGVLQSRTYRAASYTDPLDKLTIEELESIVAGDYEIID